MQPRSYPCSVISPAEVQPYTRTPEKALCRAGPSVCRSYSTEQKNSTQPRLSCTSCSASSAAASSGLRTLELATRTTGNCLTGVIGSLLGIRESDNDSTPPEPPANETSVHFVGAPNLP